MGCNVGRHSVLNNGQRAGFPCRLFFMTQYFFATSASIVFMKNFARSLGIVVVTTLVAQAQTPAPRPPQTAAQRLSANFTDINRKILEMAEDFPADKYNFKLKPEMRSFGELLIHISGGTIYAAKAGLGEKVKWDDQEPDAKKFHGKAEIVAMMKKAIADANAAIKANPEGPNKNMEPFLSVIEHSAEHYGLLVGYYRANGLVPPESRPKK
jgi:hypothetical protein